MGLTGCRPDGIWQGLEKKRREWEVEGVPVGDDFVTEVRDWAWSQAQQGKKYYCVAGQAAKGDPSAWCRKYRLSSQASFSAKLYGEAVATALSVEEYLSHHRSATLLSCRTEHVSLSHEDQHLNALG